GPGSDAGSVSASESGRASSVIKEPIARLSAGLKATVFSAGHSAESGYTSETGSASGAGLSIKNLKAQSRVSTDYSIVRSTSSEGQRLQQYYQHQLGEDQSPAGRRSKEWSSVPSTPPPPASARDKYLSPGNDVASRFIKDSRNQSTNTSLREQSSHSDSELATDDRLPPFAIKSKGNSSPILLDTYFTLHDPSSDEVLYTSETVIESNNPKYQPLEEHLFTDPVKRRSSNVVARIWAGQGGSDFFLLLEWRIDLCCLRYIGKELRDLPTSLPNNTILFGFENGFYTAPDDDEPLDHPHASIQEPIASTLGGGVSPSYTYESVMRLNNLHECIADTKKSRDEIKHNIEVALKKDNAPMIMRKAERLRREHAERRRVLAESRERGLTQEMYLEENMMNLAKNKESLFHVLKEFSTKRTELIATLFTIFPITELMNSQGLQFMDLRQTLPNLRYLMETLLTSSPSRNRQDRQEQERLSDLFIISLEQRDFERITSPRLDTSSSDSGQESGTGKHFHEKGSSSSRANTSERSGLVREYDPVEGDYMLVLDNASTMSPRSRKESSSSDASTIERVEVQPIYIEVESPSPSPQQERQAQEGSPQQRQQQQRRDSEISYSPMEAHSPPPPQQQQQQHQFQQPSQQQIDQFPPGDDALSALHDSRSTKSVDTISINTNLRGRRLSDKFGVGNRDADQSNAKELIRRHGHGQPSPATAAAASGILEASG
ncbi:hypothetical protein BGZ98_009048, partial [Dissophora globulifera]